MNITYSDKIIYFDITVKLLCLDYTMILLNEHLMRVQLNWMFNLTKVSSTVASRSRSSKHFNQ